jgi:hypothetical protein
MLTSYKTIDVVEVSALEVGDIFEWDNQVYTVESDINDFGISVGIPVYDEMDDPDILWLDANDRVNLLTIVD